MQRSDIIKSIPEPQNKDVIVYDTELLPLLEIDVFKEYKRNILEYKNKKEKFLIIDSEIKNYEKELNNLYLYNKSWTEEDYIEMLQKLKINYNKLYNDVKKIENNIEILEKKYKNINEKIEIQRNKDLKEIESKKSNIETEIQELKEKILELKEKNNLYKLEFKNLNDHKNKYIKENNDILEYIKHLEEDCYECKYCGTIITNKNSKKRILRILQENISSNSSHIEKLDVKISSIEKDIAYYENELKKAKEDLQNDIEFKKEDYNFYLKKSLKILELEATRDEILKNINELKHEYETNSKTKNQDFLKTKDLINKCELSIENLRKLKKDKSEFNSKYIEYNNLKNELINLRKKIKLYIKFIKIYFKIYEQKINYYFGNDIKFKLFKFEDLEFFEIFEVYYKDIEYTQLSKKLRDEVDKIYMEKISYFY